MLFARLSAREGAAILTRRLVLVTGKGGVGKTTIAAALALIRAQAGQRVLCAEISPDAASPSALATALGNRRLGEEPRTVAGSVDAVLLTPTMGHRRFLQEHLPLKVLADAAMRSSALRKFFQAAPGLSDMGVMYRMLDLFRRKRSDGRPEYEACVVDAPATGHALALAQIPELLLRLIPAGPIGRAAREGLAILTDPSMTGAVVVTLPETLPITEALELCEGLTRHRVPIAAVVVNRVPVDPFTDAERKAVKQLLQDTARVQGAHELQRIVRARAAVELLRKSAPAPVIEVPENADVGESVARAVGQSLGEVWRSR
ncbi:MAG: ArsA family ATPase [Myxococcota bacterium]